ncbi:hypothetical protein [Cupriavidus sp. 2SB]|uniref:hypothetical protein n=1 Tax=Cupriavidus sp. 2SB TaxID=2502199 RepID=UPI0010F9819F|nr:hypothetical protein [Cupriavidus sp. 2SB]
MSFMMPSRLIGHLRYPDHTTPIVEAPKQGQSVTLTVETGAAPHRREAECGWVSPHGGHRRVLEQFMLEVPGRLRPALHGGTPHQNAAFSS